MIEYQTKEYPKEAILKELHPLVREWFLKKFGEFSPPQKYAILNIRHRENTLISSPTGSGKTLSAFLAIINELIFLSKEQMREKRSDAAYFPFDLLEVLHAVRRPLREGGERL